MSSQKYVDTPEYFNQPAYRTKCALAGGESRILDNHLSAEKTADALNTKSADMKRVFGIDYFEIVAVIHLFILTIFR